MALLCLCAPHSSGGQSVVGDAPRQESRLLGVGLSAEVSSWLEEVERKLGKEIYADRWTRSLADGRRLAETIRAAGAQTPTEVTALFLRCLPILYGAEFRVEPDARFPLARIYPQMLIHVRRPARRR